MRGRRERGSKKRRVREISREEEGGREVVGMTERKEGDR